jgi:hypothetical protein
LTKKEKTPKDIQPEKIVKPGKEKAKKPSKVWQTIAIPLLAVLTGLLVGVIVIIVSDAQVVAAYKNFFHDPLNALSLTFQAVGTSYGAWLKGCFGSPVDFFRGLQTYFATGNT